MLGSSTHQGAWKLAVAAVKTVSEQEPATKEIKLPCRDYYPKSHDAMCNVLQMSSKCQIGNNLLVIKDSVKPWVTSNHRTRQSWTITDDFTGIIVDNHKISHLQWESLKRIVLMISNDQVYIYQR